jgi:integrase
MTQITELELKRLAPGARITDEAIEGFVARRLPSGKISFGYQYTDKATAARRWIGIGLHGNVTVKEARDLAKQYAGQVAAREDPAAEHKMAAARSENTVDHVLDKFLELYVAGENLRSASAITQCFANHIRPAIGAKVIYDLKRADIMRIVDKVAKDYPRSAHVVLARLRKAFNWWQLRDEEFKTPIVRGMVRDKTTARNRVLTSDELRDIWQALDELDHVPVCFAAFVRVLFLTACRRCEVSDMHSDEIFGDRWVIPAARYKTAIDHVVPLIPAVKNLLPKHSGFVFSTDGGTKPMRGFTVPKKYLDEKIAEIRKREHRKPMPAWTFHDLRRTARTLLAELHVDRDTAEAVLGHVIGGVEGTYNQHKYFAEKTDALTKLARYVDRLTKARSSAPAAKLRLVAG